MTSFELSSGQEAVLNTSGNLLVFGGPGAGKTTIAILKAGKLVENRTLFNQKILFLSFARSTVSRVTEVLNQHSLFTEETKCCIDVDTYHAFFWRIIKTHGYLLGLPRRLSILPPPEEAVSLSRIRSDYTTRENLSEPKRREKERREKEERERFAYKEGKICFCLFTDLATDLMRGSKKIRQLVSVTFPTVILDEFQDTSAGQWNVVKELGKNSTLIALVDPEQSIYGFTGADPDRRINEYRQYTKPIEFNLDSTNHRSTETDIVEFGKSILNGKFRRSFTRYQGVNIVSYNPNSNQAFYALKIQILCAKKRLIAQQSDDWSIAVLVPTKKLMQQVSEKLNQAIPKIIHHASVDIEGAVLATEILVFLMQPKLIGRDIFEILNLLSNFFRGKGGDIPTQTAIKEGQRIEKAANKAIEFKNAGKNLPGNSIIHPISRTYQECRALKFLGDPEKDWSSIRDILKKSDCLRFKKVAEDVKNIRIIERGTQLFEALSQAWRETGAYTNALDIVRKFFAQEYFARLTNPETGIIVMNMHKAKGYQFDEVIIFEGWPRRPDGNIVSNPDRIVRGNVIGENDYSYTEQSKKNLYVSITRAKARTTIMTPKDDPCILLPNVY